MVDIKVHENENNNLCSIKGVDDDYSGRQYLLNLLRRYFDIAGYVLVYVRRNNYEVDSSIKKLKEEGISIGVTNLKIVKNLFQASFYLVKMD